MTSNPIRLTGATICIAALTACGGGGGSGGGGGNALNQDEQAAVAAFGAKLFASAAQGFANNTSPDDDAEEAALRAKQQQECNDSDGSFSTSGPTTEDVNSPYTSDGSLSVSRYEADNCRNSFSGNGFSSESLQDGLFLEGSAESGAVAFFQTSELGTEPATSDPYITESSSSGNPGISSELRALMHVCDGCSMPPNGEDFALQAYLDGDFDFGEDAFSFQYGRDSSTPLVVSELDTGGGTRETEINGFLAFSFADGCAFEADYETVDPLLTENAGTENEQFVGGRLALDVNGENVDVEFQQDGAVLVDGERFTEADFEEIDERCDFAIEQEQAAG